MCQISKFAKLIHQKLKIIVSQPFLSNESINPYQNKVARQQIQLSRQQFYNTMTCKLENFHLCQYGCPTIRRMVAECSGVWNGRQLVRISLQTFDLVFAVFFSRTKLKKKMVRKPTHSRAGCIVEPYRHPNIQQYAQCLVKNRQRTPHTHKLFYG